MRSEKYELFVRNAEILATELESCLNVSDETYVSILIRKGGFIYIQTNDENITKELSVPDTEWERRESDDGNFNKRESETDDKEYDNRGTVGCC